MTTTLLGFVLKAFFFFCCWEATHSEDGSKSFENGCFAGHDEEEGKSWLRTFASAELGLAATLIRALDFRLTLSTYKIQYFGYSGDIKRERRRAISGKNGTGNFSDFTGWVCHSETHPSPSLICICS